MMRRRRAAPAPTALLYPVVMLVTAAALPGASPEDPSAIKLREVAADWGLDFRHHHGGSGRRYMVETMSGGVVILDYDADGDEDVFFVDGGALPGYEGEPARSRLFRNDGDGNGDGDGDGAAGGSRRFVDVTSGSRLEVDVYGNGATAGDCDGDGDLDLYLTAFGPNRLYRNLGDGRFADATTAAGVADPLWSSSAAFSDVDRDGDLDLYVANYVAFDFDVHQDCVDPANGLSIYCQPSTYPGVPDRFYRNRGDCVFDDATAGSGFDVREDMAGLGLAFGDLNDDGWPDLYVANDTEPNFLFLSRGEGRVEEEGLLSGTAVGERGTSEAGMGVELGDVDGDGHLDIVVTNFEMESNALYRNQGGGFFVDSRYPTRIAEPSLLPLAFGVALADLDHDADLDLVVANGHVRDNAAEFRDRSRYGQLNQVFENRGDGVFRAIAGAGLEHQRVSRGLAAGDLDGDGDLDLVAVNSNQPAEVYENVSTTGGGWLRVDLAADRGNTGGVDGRITVLSGGRRQLREVRTGVSYQSQGALGAHFGLGAAAEAIAVDALEIRWPDGRRQRLTGLPAGRRVRVGE